jgi:DNA-binding SARP family transcriptional activator
MSEGLAYAVLGPLEVRCGGVVLDLGGAKQRAVLALLLADANRVVPVDRLIWLLWGEEAPNRATATLQAYVSHLRRLLEPDRAPRAEPRVLLTRPPGYLLAVDDDALDARRFELPLEEARARLADGDAAAARRASEAALALWWGDALADIVELPPGERVTARLEALRLVAHETHVDALLAVGDHGTAVAVLEDLLVAHPFHERFSAQLMLALYRAGRQADALAVARRVREQLADALGVDPGPELARLELDILRQAPELHGAVHDAAAPPVVVPVAGAAAPVAAARVAASPVAGAPTPAAEPAPASATDTSGTTLVGRAGELDALRGLAGAAVRGGVGGVALVSGGAGIGKTALTEAFAAAAHAAGLVVGHAGAHDRGDPPLFVWGRALAAVLDALDPDRRDEVLAAGADELALSCRRPGGPDLRDRRRHRRSRRPPTPRRRASAGSRRSSPRSGPSPVIGRSPWCSTTSTRPTRRPCASCASRCPRCATSPWSSS